MGIKSHLLWSFLAGKEKQLEEKKKCTEVTGGCGHGGSFLTGAGRERCEGGADKHKLATTIATEGFKHPWETKCPFGVLNM